MVTLCRWVAVALLAGLGACASQNGEREFRLESGERVHFAGTLEDGRFVQGRAVYSQSDADSARAVFEGRFDPQGYPDSGSLEKVLLGAGGELLTLQLVGDFNVQAGSSAIDFLGDFTLVDSRGQLLAEGNASHWQGRYTSKVHPYIAPGQFGLTGAVEYRQYQRRIPLAGDPLQLVDVQRSLQGPFWIEAHFTQGRPQGKLRITAENIGGQAYLTEHQFLSPQAAYFFYEPGSFNEIELLGDCDTSPTLTVPLSVLQAFAYDCGRSEFLAVSPEFRGSQLAIQATDIDNNGGVRRLVVRRGEQVIDMQIDHQALFEGTLQPHGRLLTFEGGALRSLRHYQQGHLVGIGIDAEGESARYVRFKWQDSNAVMPSPALLPDLAAQYEQRQSWLVALDQTTTDGGAHLHRQIEAASIPVAGSQVTGLQAMLQQWQWESMGRLKAWSARKDPVSALAASLKGSLDHWWARSRQLVLDQAERACAADGKRLNADQWQCELAPDAATEQLCLQHFGEISCQQMAQSLALGDLGD